MEPDMSSTTPSVVFPTRLVFELTAVEFCLFLTLRSYTDHGTWPTAKQLAEDMGCSVSTVNRTMAKIRKRGLVTGRKVHT